jgi:hypothetical protein
LIRARIARWLLSARSSAPAAQPLAPRALKPLIKDQWVDFYDEKSTLRESFVYRRLAYDLAQEPGKAGRLVIVEDFKKQLDEQGAHGEFLKFKWCLPYFLRTALFPNERADLESWLAARRKKRNRRFVRALPHCSDEFDVTEPFLDATFPVADEPTISKETRVYTMGSCFARNIAVFLQANGYNANTFLQTEDLNSPFSNAQMLAVAVAAPSQKNGYLRHWIKAIHEPISEAGVERQLRKVTERLDKVVAELRAASVIIVTVGNVLDFFIDTPDAGFDISGTVNVAPKFLLLPDKAEITKRVNLTSRLRSLGANFRMGSLAEARIAIASFYGAIRKINASALCIVTLSPVPIDNAVGLQERLPYGALEIDCVSKSTLRVALHELMSEWTEQDANIRYFPSYEIVRWVGPMLPEPAFGAEDAASRHVSKSILNGVYAFFIKKFGAPLSAELATEAFKGQRE